MSMHGIKNCWERGSPEELKSLRAILVNKILLENIFLGSQYIHWNWLNFANFTLVEILFKTIWKLPVCWSKSI